MGLLTKIAFDAALPILLGRVAIKKSPGPSHDDPGPFFILFLLLKLIKRYVE